MSLGRSFSLTWLGHSTFKLTTGSGKVILIDPWVQGNPACPDECKQLAGVDAILITHGHFDHMGDAVEIAAAHKPEAVVGIFEVCHWLESKGVENCSAMNKGGTQEVAGTRVTMTHAIHSGGDQKNRPFHESSTGLWARALSLRPVRSRPLAAPRRRGDPAAGTESSSPPPPALP